MTDQMILTSYFIDKPEPAFDILAQPKWKKVVAALPDGDQQARVAPLHKAIADEVASALERGQRPVSLAGDCCAALGVMTGLQRAGLSPTLLWLDAHGDFNTWETTPSNFLGGMPLAMAVGLGEQRMLDQLGMKPWPEDRVILADGRDLDPGERELLAASNIRHESTVAALLAEGGLPHGPLYVHYDTDIIDASDAPAMNYPTSGGPRAAEIKQLFRALAESERMVAISVSLWAPRLDPDGTTGALVMETVDVLRGIRKS